MEKIPKKFLIGTNNALKNPAMKALTLGRSDKERGDQFRLAVDGLNEISQRG